MGGCRHSWCSDDSCRSSMRSAVAKAETPLDTRADDDGPMYQFHESGSIFVPNLHGQTGGSDTPTSQSLLFFRGGRIEESPRFKKCFSFKLVPLFSLCYPCEAKIPVRVRASCKTKGCVCVFLACLETPPDVRVPWLGRNPHFSGVHIMARSACFP